MNKRSRSFSRAKARALSGASRGMKFDLMVITAVLVLLLVSVALAPRAEAQVTFPRLGISASAESYVDSLDVEIGHEFTLYLCAFGFEPGDPMDQEVSVLQWAVHQVCCGAVLEVMDIEYNPNFSHSGDPYMGVSSSSETCVTEDSIVLATMTMSLHAPEPGEYLAAAGPIGPAYDCDGNNPLFMDMPLTLYATGEVTPVENSTWGAVKAVYR